MTKMKLPDPQPFQLIIFPLPAQIGKVRHVTGKYLEQTTADGQQRYWNTITLNLRKLLAKQGCSEAEIAEHVTAFREAVQKEIDRRKPWDKPKNGPSDPKGAA